MQLKKFKNEVIPLRQKMLSAAFGVLHNTEDAEDAVQETLLRLWKNAEKFDEIDNLSAFAFQMLKNICIDKTRKKKEFSLDDTFNETVSETPYFLTEKNNTVEIIAKIIEKLPELQKIIITMRDVQGYELSEIAEITGTQTNAVTMNLSRARKKVRETYFKLLNYNDL